MEGIKVKKNEDDIRLAKPLDVPNKGLSEKVFNHKLISAYSSIHPKLTDLVKLKKVFFAQLGADNSGAPKLSDREYDNFIYIFLQIKSICELFANRYNQNHFKDVKHFQNRLETLRILIYRILDAQGVQEDDKNQHKLMIWYHSISYDPITSEKLSSDIIKLKKVYLNEYYMLCNQVNIASSNSKIDKSAINPIKETILETGQTFSELLLLIEPIGSCLILRKLPQEEYCNLFKDFEKIVALLDILDNFPKSRNVISDVEIRFFRYVLDRLPKKRTMSELTG